jgi:FAD:protein FMN transferase
VSRTYLHSFVAMGTVVTLRVNRDDASSEFERTRAELLDRAIGWFSRVEHVCNRFDPESEISRLAARPDTWVPLSSLLFSALEFALALAKETDGAFDPTVGRRLEARGFNRSYRTGEIVRSGADSDEEVSFRDVRLDAENRTARLERPMKLDLGAVAKGLAIDLAARELRPLQNFAVDAGGDVYVGGLEDGQQWRVGIRHPRLESELIEALEVTDAAVCTSGDYERPAPGGGHHILDARTGDSPSELASVSVVGPSAMIADAFGTAAMVLGPREGLAFLERQQADGLLVTTNLERLETRGMSRHIYSGPRAAILA